MVDLKKAIAAFGAEAKAKLSNPSAYGEPEEQLRTPLVIDFIGEQAQGGANERVGLAELLAYLVEPFGQTDVARLCRLLRDEVTEQLAEKSPALTALAADWRKLLFPEANDQQFADGYAQAVTFGLLMARSR